MARTFKGLSLRQVKEDLVSINEIGDGMVNYRIEGDALLADIYGYDNEIHHTLRVGISLEAIDNEMSN